MAKEIDLIKNTTLLNPLSREDIHRNLRNGNFRVVSYKKNSVVHFEGEPCNNLEIILSGKVVVERIDKSGNLLVISEFYNDDILGGNLLFSKNPYYLMTVSTKSPTLMLEINRDVLFELFSHNSIILRTYLGFISDHAIILGEKIKHGNQTLRERIMSYLNYEQKRQNSNHITLNMTKKALAEKIGVQRTSLSRELAKMKQEGLILFDADSFTLLNKESRQ